jgi:hypothetical protein
MIQYISCAKRLRKHFLLFLITILVNESSHCAISECFSSKKGSRRVLIFFSHDLAVLVGLGLLYEEKSRIASSTHMACPRKGHINGGNRHIKLITFQGSF